jgi:hypothetical protein
LDKSIDHKALHDAFSTFGRILSCKENNLVKLTGGIVLLSMESVLEFCLLKDWIVYIYLIYGGSFDMRCMLSVISIELNVM